MELPFLMHGATIALAWFLLINVAAAALLAIGVAWLTRRARLTSPGFWLALRLSPAALAIGFVAFVFLPSYWRYEPREFVEGFDVPLTTLAVAAAGVIACAMIRGVLASRDAARRVQRWLNGAEPLALAGTSMPAFAIDTDVPVMALVGVLRPRLLIARPVLDTLTSEELQAAIAHELGHRRAWDNMKRLAMRAAPDVLGATSIARAIERQWAAASEHTADRRAGDAAGTRYALASALVKVARLVPPVTTMAEPISALLDGGDITARVERLLEDTPPVPASRWTRWFPLAVAATALALTYTPLLRLVHDVTEVLVNGPH